MQKSHWGISLFLLLVVNVQADQVSDGGLADLVFFSLDSSRPCLDAQQYDLV